MKLRSSACLAPVFATACLSLVAGPAAADAAAVESDPVEEIRLEDLPADDNIGAGAPTVLELLAGEEAALLLDAGLDPAIVGAAGQLHVDRSATKADAGARGTGAPAPVRLAPPKPFLLTLRYRTQISVYDRTDTPPPLHRPPRVNAKRRKKLANRFARVTPQVTQCYGQPLFGEGSQRHRVVAGVTVDRKGAVIAARILHNTRKADFEVEACIRRVLSTLTFPRRLGRGPVELVYPWRFWFQDW